MVNVPPTNKRTYISKYPYINWLKAFCAREDDNGDREKARGGFDFANRRRFVSFLWVHISILYNRQLCSVAVVDVDDVYV